MLKNQLLILFLFFFLLIGCTKDFEDNGLIDIYSEMMDSLVLECVKGTSSNYLSLKMDEQEVCYYEGVENREVQFGISSKFTTDSPSFSTNGPVKNARKGASLRIIKNPIQNRAHFIDLKFPDFNLSVDTLHYLDSIFAITDHDIIGIEDVEVPPNLSKAEAYSLKSNGGYLKKFKIDFNIPHVTIPNSGYLSLASSSIHGNQDGSFLKFKKVAKNIKRDGVYYSLEIEFKCKLYHFPQHGVTGLFKEITDGRFAVQIKAVNF